MFLMIKKGNKIECSIMYQHCFAADRNAGRRVRRLMLKELFDIFFLLVFLFFFFFKDGCRVIRLKGCEADPVT